LRLRYGMACGLHDRAHRPRTRDRRAEMHRDKIIDIIAFGLMTLTLATMTACPSEKSSEETGPASRGTDDGGETGPKPATAN
jgi:hypothetical protein